MRVTAGFIFNTRLFFQERYSGQDLFRHHISDDLLAGGSSLVYLVGSGASPDGTESQRNLLRGIGKSHINHNFELPDLRNLERLLAGSLNRISAGVNLIVF
jgi:hypothetical protein